MHRDLANHACPACGRYIGLHNRCGELVGHEYHNARVEEVSAVLIGSGISGLGSWRVQDAWVCDWPDIITKVGA